MKAARARRVTGQDRRSLACWAADCAEHVLHFFADQYPGDERPRAAIEAARSWMLGDMKVSDARATAFAAHAAARDASEPRARAAARAAGHAAATAHVPGHARHAAAYALNAAGTAAERDWQAGQLRDYGIAQRRTSLSASPAGVPLQSFTGR